ncbi:hypothetical protein GQ42DRAFT_19018 [Ramicandelaber brevisporus]|nr:hypothetical protein GQ42DRAFT_19018 [Ramicandelaber brevisporus]
MAVTATSVFRGALHIGLAYLFFVAIPPLEPEFPIMKEYGGRHNFLTIVGLSLSGVVSVVAALSELTPSLLSAPLASLHRLLMSVALPLEFLITVMYWTLKTVDPTLLAPPEFTNIIPFEVDLGLHLVPFVALLLDFLVFTDYYRAGAVHKLATVALGAGYYAWISHANSVHGLWPYPLLEVIEKQYHVGLVAGLSLVMIIFQSIAFGIKSAFTSAAVKAKQD